MRKRPTQKEKTRLAYRAYTDLVDTADWIRGELRAQLEAFGLTWEGFRLLGALYREGPVTVPMAAERRGRTRQNMDIIVARLEERGWVRRTVVTYQPVQTKHNHFPKEMRGRRRKGRQVAVVGLTPLGEKFIGHVLPRHAKLVKSQMRALDGREKESLSRICRKLREGDVVRFVSELTHRTMREMEDKTPI